MLGPGGTESGRVVARRALRNPGDSRSARAALSMGRVVARSGRVRGAGYFRLSRYSAIAARSDGGSLARFSWIAAMPPLEMSS